MGDGLGEFIEQRRRELGLSQRGLADRLDVSPKLVSKWERQMAPGWHPRRDTLHRLSEALEVEVETLVDQIAMEPDDEITVTEAIREIRAILGRLERTANRERLNGDEDQPL